MCACINWLWHLFSSHLHQINLALREYFHLSVRSSFQRFGCANSFFFSSSAAQRQQFYNKYYQLCAQKHLLAVSVCVGIENLPEFYLQFYYEIYFFCSIFSFENVFGFVARETTCLDSFSFFCLIGVSCLSFHLCAFLSSSFSFALSIFFCPFLYGHI